MEITAIGKYMRTSTKKTRPVLDLIRDKSVDQAGAILEYNKKQVSMDVLKVLNSAVANARHNNNLDDQTLKVTTAFVTKGPLLKRMRFASRGRTMRIRKHTSHITVGVSVDETKIMSKKTKTTPKETAPKELSKKLTSEKKTNEKKSTNGEGKKE